MTVPHDALEAANSAIAKACQNAGRDRDDVTLVAVSKTRSAEEIRPLLDSGHRVFGENRVQEAAEKWPSLRSAYADIELHLVGQLQSNKAADAVALFDVIHSVDRPSLVDALTKAMAKQGRDLSCLLQVNIGEESQKGGCALADISSLLAHARDRNLNITGLMCVPPADVEASPYFALLAKLAKDHDLPLSSMGMSADYETAVMLGAHYVRVGTALFGPRP